MKCRVCRKSVFKCCYFTSPMGNVFSMQNILVLFGAIIINYSFLDIQSI